MTIAQPVLVTERLQLVPANETWAGAMLAYHWRNNEHFAPWDPRGPEFFSLLYWQARLRQRQRDWAEGRGAAFLLIYQEQLIGTISLSNIVRAMFQACFLGYGLDKDYQGQGLMQEALQSVIAFAFDELKLHRIQANYQPENARSAALLQRLGFVREGLAKDYLFINNAWRDHVLTSLVNPSPILLEYVG